MVTGVTSGEIAERCGVKLHKVVYLLRSRGIQPIRRFANIRIFSPETADLVASELARRNRRSAA